MTPHIEQPAIVTAVGNKPKQSEGFAARAIGNSSLGTATFPTSQRGDLKCFEASISLTVWPPMSAS